MASKKLILFAVLCCFLTLCIQSGKTQDIIPMEPTDHLPDSLRQQQDTLAIDSIQPDSTKNAIEAPISYAAKDSMVMLLDGKNMVYLYGEGKVAYTNLTLDAEYVEIDANNKILYATFGRDSIGEEFGYPIFKEGETQYEMKKARYNFETKKMFITDVITQQGEGFLVAERSKKMSNDDLYLEKGRYTTCDDHDHPHFYLSLSKAKVTPGKRVVMGPAHLVLEDVPTPIFIPFGFFPFTSDYSSGVIMPKYEDELRRGFGLRDGGYYFAFNDHVDLALTGEIYTKGSWGLQASSNYRKRYKYSGTFNASYLNTVEGEKGDADYNVKEDFSVKWSHSQDSKSNPFLTFSASVDFSTSSYNQNSLNTQYSDAATQNTKRSNISLNYRIPDSPFSLTAAANISQVSRDSTLTVTLPTVAVSMRDIYPFRRKEQVGTPRWYENIRMSYSGKLENSIHAKEKEFFQKNIIKDWSNGMQHSIPISASFTLFKYITITPNITYNEKWYSSRLKKGWDEEEKTEVVVDTVYGFNRVYDFNGSVKINTKLYGFYKPWAIFGKQANNTIIRHVFTPSVSFSGKPDFSSDRFGMYDEYDYINEEGERIVMPYDPYDRQRFGGVSRGQSGNINFTFDNNLEMKVPIQDSDSTKKISLIDNLSFGFGYNMLADSFKWSKEVGVNLRLKFGKSYTLNLQGTFDTYVYDENGRLKDKLRIGSGKGLGRLKNTTPSFSYTLSNQTVKEWFSKDKKDPDAAPENEMSAEDINDNLNAGLDMETDESPRKSLREKKKSDDKFDDDGYWLTDIPWSLSMNCSAQLSYDYTKFNKQTREYGYKITPSIGLRGSISPTKNWNFNFSTDYDFDYKGITRMTCSITRKMHCWQMSASFTPIGRYSSYHFTIAVSSAMLRDLKYTQSSSSRDAKNWGIKE